MSQNWETRKRIERLRMDMQDCDPLDIIGQSRIQYNIDMLTAELKPECWLEMPRSILGTRDKTASLYRWTHDLEAGGVTPMALVTFIGPDEESIFNQADLWCSENGWELVS